MNGPKWVSPFDDPYRTLAFSDNLFRNRTQEYLLKVAPSMSPALRRDRQFKQIWNESESINQPNRAVACILKDLAGHAAEKKLFCPGHTAAAHNHCTETT